MPIRSTQEVFDDHLQLARQGDIETDIARNYAEDCVLLTTYGVFKGHDGVREAAVLLDRQLPDARFVYRTRLVYGEIAFLEWTGESEHFRVEDGTDTFLIRDGKIQVMTFHYTLTTKR